MKRMSFFGVLLLCASLIFGFMLLGIKTANATDFKIIEVTDSSLNNYDVRLNNHGQIAYRTVNGNGEYEIYFYNNGKIAKISNSFIELDHLQLNDQGQIAWRGYDGDDYEIYFYNNGITSQITDNKGDDNTRENSWSWLNNNGKFVWWWSDGNWDGYEYDVYLFNGSGISRVTNTTDYSESEVRINNSGQIVWFRTDYFGSDMGLYLYSGGSTAEITRCSDCSANQPMIKDLNDNGQVLWLGYDGINYEIYLYSNGTNTQITDSDNEDSFNFQPQINNKGQIVWSESDGNDYEIFLYSDGVTTQITHNNYDDYIDLNTTQINNKGQIVWCSRDDENGYPVYAVNLYNNGIVSQIEERPYVTLKNPIINNSGQIVWQRVGYANDGFHDVILLATPAKTKKASISTAVLQLLLN